MRIGLPDPETLSFIQRSTRCGGWHRYEDQICHQPPVPRPASAAGDRHSDRSGVLVMQKNVPVAGLCQR